MKRIKAILFFALCTLTFVACDNGDNNDLPNKPIESKCYKGIMSVDQNDGTMYTQGAVEVDYELRGEDKLNFVMYKVKFASGMPIKLDMVVEGVNYTEIDGNYTISGENIVPYAMGGPFERFTITQLEGTITESEMSMTFMCGEYPVTYEGFK